MQNHHPKPIESPVFRNGVESFGNFFRCFLDPDPDLNFVPQRAIMAKKVIVLVAYV